MRKLPKKLLTACTAVALTFSVLAFPACTSFTPLSGDYNAGEVSSNGGFVVEKGNYCYFINGVETYTSDNTYGTPVKGALMRILKSDLDSGKNSAEIVVPSLMVAADYTSGIYVYGDRVYYATPTTVKNTSGTVENSYLDFKSAKLDGSDVRSYFNISDNATVYRYVEVNNVVYLMYVDGSDLHSYNTNEKKDTLLAAGTKAYVLNSTDKTDPTFYYTMGVTVDIDKKDGSSERGYNQIYSVTADVTKAPYEYKYDQAYLDENDGKEPYTNLGTIVLDGIGANYVESPTQFTHDLKEGVTPLSPSGYTYELQSYTNGGIYFTRTGLDKTSSVGETGWLYYLAKDKTASGWNSVSGNASDKLDAIAQSTTNASKSAIFYTENGAHHYLYVDGANMFRADVKKDGSAMADTTLIARGVSGATLVSIDNTSDSTYHYVYYTMSGTTGKKISRAVYNGTEDDYKVLNYDQNEAYQPVQVLNIENANSWYEFEIVDGKVFFADTEALGSTSYNYISCVDLTNGSGKLMNNVELAAYNDRYDELVGTDGYFTTLSEDYSNLSNAVKYYFYAGQDELFYRDAKDYKFSDGYLTYETSLFYTNIQNAVKEGKKTTYLYSEEEQELFKAYTEGKGDSAKFVDEKGVSYRTRSYFVTRLGQMSDADRDSYESYWKTYLKNYTVVEEETSMPTWAWVLIGVGIGVVVVAIGLSVFFVLRAKKRKDEAGEEEELLYVDTTDDKDVDVYADDEAQDEAQDDNVLQFPGAAADEEADEPAESDESNDEPEELAEPDEDDDSTDKE